MIDGKQAVEILLDSSEDKISAFIELIERESLKLLLSRTFKWRITQGA